MDFLGIGPMELLMVLLVGLLVLGPNKMLAMARNAGKTWRDFQQGWRSAMQDLTIDSPLESEESAPLPPPEGQRLFKPGADLTTGVSPEAEEASSQEDPG